MKSLLLMIVLVGCQIGASDVPSKLVLTVYYESKCPDSRNFIIKQLEPAVNALSERLIVRLIPFGKAMSINNGFTQFECQHGPPECLGNMIQACSLRWMLDRPDTDAVSYVACEMRSLASTTGSFQCVRQAQVPTDLVHECITSIQGTDLLLEAERATNLIRPKFIPTITINDVFDQKIQDSALTDLIGTLCSILKGDPLCRAHYNTQALQYIML